MYTYFVSLNYVKKYIKIVEVSISIRSSSCASVPQFLSWSEMLWLMQYKLYWFLLQCLFLLIKIPIKKNKFEILMAIFYSVTLVLYNREWKAGNKETGNSVWQSLQALYVLNIFIAVATTSPLLMKPHIPTNKLKKSLRYQILIAGRLCSV